MFFVNQGPLLVSGSSFSSQQPERRIRGTWPEVEVRGQAEAHLEQAPPSPPPPSPLVGVSPRTATTTTFATGTARASTSSTTPSTTTTTTCPAGPSSPAGRSGSRGSSASDTGGPEQVARDDPVWHRQVQPDLLSHHVHLLPADVLDHLQPPEWRRDSWRTHLLRLEMRVRQAE